MKHAVLPKKQTRHLFTDNSKREMLLSCDVKKALS